MIQVPLGPEAWDHPTAVAKHIGRISQEIEALIEKKVAFRTPTQLVTFEQRSWELRNK